MRRVVLGLVAVALVAEGCSNEPRPPVVVGAIYPLSGAQGPGGVEEYRGVALAAAMANADGGVRGRSVRIEAVDVAGSDAAPAAVASLHRAGIRLVIGSYGSTISRSASMEASRRGMLFWETGAVGQLFGQDLGRLVFRVAPMGASLGSSAISFVADQLAPKLGRDPASLRFAVANVDDVYGQTVARGAVARIRELGLPFVGQFSYDARTLDPTALVRRITAAHPDVLFSSAYMQDGISLRRAMVRRHLRLLVNIGTSSSYCMQSFGDALGADAVGLFASDKPDQGDIDPGGLAPAARALLARAGVGYRKRYGGSMSAAALAGFSGAWALFHSILPRATAMTPDAVAAAARSTAIPVGGLPNGSGLLFGTPGGPDAGDNLRAASVIWEWVGLRQRAVVWPPEYATHPVRALPIAS